MIYNNLPNPQPLLPPPNVTMSSSNAFIRALSPAMEGLTQAVHNSHLLSLSEPDSKTLAINDRFFVLQGKVAECRSVEQVIDAVPSDYRQALREHLLSYSSWCEKMETVKTSLERLTRALEAQTVPPRLRVKAPEFQFTKEFGDSNTDASNQARTSFNTATATYQEAINVAAKSGKKAELDFWVNKCSLPKLLEAGTDIVNAVWTARHQSFRVPVIVYNEEGRPTIGDWEVPSQKKIERDCLIKAFPTIGTHIGQLVSIRHRSMEIKIQKKKEVAAKADVEMTNATTAGPSIQSLIDKGLNARLKKLNLVPGKKVNSRSYSSSTALANDCSNYSELVWPREKGSETEVRSDFFDGPSKRETKVYGSNVQEKRRGKDCQEEDGQREAESPVIRSKRERKSKGIVTDPSVSILNPSTIPDEILNYTWDDAVTYVLLHTPIDFLEAGQYRNQVHCSDGVIVPPEIANDLSLGLKYMFFSPPNKKLIAEAWSEFQARLRWRIFFLFKEGVNKPYDPDYSVRRNKHNKSPPKLPQWMELGLVMGRRYVNGTIASLPDEKLMEIQKNPFTPKKHKILRFLKDNNYVITMTDKNLGLAVSERDWLIRNELKLLEDERNYKQLSKSNADSIMKSKIEKMKLLSYTTENHLFLNELKVHDYFRSLIPLEGEYIYPQFHGLPKIHKKPTGFRPIIPCHSVCFNPAAKFVSKELKPLILSAPSIIHGTKDLFIRLSQLRIKPGRKFYFVTGDVVAYYPNVPLQQCMEIVNSMYEQWLLDHSVVTDMPQITENSIENNLLRLEIFKRAIEIGNTQLITQHGDKYFEQLNGLAMGVADSPDLANLYGVHFEEKAKILQHPQVVFYGRYIDDCIAIVYAESADRALRLISDTIKFDKCVIEWAVSGSQCQFLDAVIFKGENNQLRWRPFVKAGNNRERIPWVSHHPIDVKRGVYIGELSRLAVLCSHKEIYIEAVRDLNALYQARGYPVPLFMSWCKKNSQERWEKRFTLRTDTDQRDESVLVLKTRFDDVWNWFSATELGNTITKYWEEWYERAVDDRYSTSDPSRLFPAPMAEDEHDLVDIQPGLYKTIRVKGEEEYVPDLGRIGILGSRWIVSRKRTTNLFDLANVWKKIVFQKLDETIADEGGVDPTIPIVEEDNEPGEDLPHNLASTDEVSDVILHRRSRSIDQEHPEFGRSSKFYT